MEKDKAFMAEGLNRTASRQPTWNASSFGIIEMQTEQVGSYFSNPNWDNSMDQSDPFESALSSMVSSPAVSNVAGSGENVMIRELIGRLGNICSSVDISPQAFIKPNNTNTSANASSYTTPLNSPPRLNLSMLNLPTLPPLSTDPGFSERAARYSCFSNTSNFGSLNDPLMDSLKLSGNQSIKVNGSQSNNNSQMEGDSGSDKKTSRLSRSSSPEKTESGVSKEESSIYQQIPGGDSGMKVLNDVNTRKRKSIPRGKAKEIPSPEAKVAAENDESNSKRGKQDGNEKESKEPPKDYIHVRARRGQATDSHSLAERVRREKISERMKFLQDLVPGCNKVTGKAVMLDEIINYVQSLQRQVEFLSMKLSTVNPRTDINMEALLSEDMYQSGGSLPHAIYSMDTSGPSSPFGYQPQQGQPLNNGISHTPQTHFSMKRQGFPVDGLTDANPQVGSIWEDDLQSIVQMGFGQSQAQSCQSLIASRQVKLEL